MLNNKLFGSVLLAVLFLCGQAFSAEKPLVFPGAVGFGVDTPAGRGGKVIKVTNLNGKGPGSLREALAAKGPRIIVFEVGGVIDLEKKDLIVVNPFFTVAGQTAPSPGITIIRGQFGIATHDILLRHIRIRPGDGCLPRQPDGITAYGRDAYNFVVDHCSITWAIDENVSTTGSVNSPEEASRRVTFSNCIIAEGLKADGDHSMGAMISDFCTDVAFIGNLFADNYSRNPYFKGRTTGVIVNNVIYNPFWTAIQLWWHPSEWRGKVKPANARVSIVGNVYIPRGDTPPDLPMVTTLGDVYLEDNMAYNRAGGPAKMDKMIGGDIVILKKKPVWPQGLVALPSSKVEAHVAKNVGARPKDRDKIDKRIIKGVLERSGCIINSQEDVGGYPKQKMTRRTLKVPDKDVGAWLEKFTAEVQ